MVTRSNMPLVSQARRGDAIAQYALGRHYLEGSGGMARNPALALDWLQRAASGGVRAAEQLICSAIPVDLALDHPQAGRIAACYRRQALAGAPEAEWAYLHLFEKAPELACAEHAQAHLFATLLLESLASGGSSAAGGHGEAQWALARRQEELGNLALARHWAGLAARQGCAPATLWLARQALRAGDTAAFLTLVRPEVERLLGRSLALSADECELLLQVFQASHWDDPLAQHALLRAAEQDHAASAFELGRLFLEPRQLGARRGAGHPDPARTAHLLGLAAEGLRPRPRPALRTAAQWLEVAARKGHADATFLLGLICRSPAYSRRDTARSDQLLQSAATAGQHDAQFRLAHSCWRRRHVEPRQQLQAMQWMVRAATGGHQGAEDWLDALAAREAPQARSGRSTRGARQGHAAPARGGCDWPVEHFDDARIAALMQRHPAMAMRIAVGKAFGLRRMEVLLTDWQRADRDNCLMIELSAWTPKHALRIVPIRTPGQRQILDLARYRFRDLDTGPDGPEGNYRQRLYLFNKLVRAAQTRRVEPRTGANRTEAARAA